MSEMKNFDDHLKRSFGGYSPEVPPHIWENIVAGRKKREPAAFWLNKKNILGLITLLVVLTGTGLLLTKNQDANSKIISHETNAGSRQQGTATAVPPAVVKDNTIAATQNNPTIINTADNKKENLQPIDNNDPTIAGSSSHSNLSITNPATRKVINNSTTNISNNLLVANNTGNNKKATAFTPRKNMVKKKSKGNFTVQINEAEVAESNEAANEKENGTEEQTMQEGFLTSRLQYSAEKLTAASLADLDHKTTEFKGIQIPCPEKDAASNKQYWEVYAGPDYAFKKYRDTALSALLEKRKASTSFQSAFSAGIRYTRVFNNGMSLRGGINYSQINEKFSYAQGNVIQLTYEINQAGDTINSYYVRGTKYKTTYNHYRTLDIPLLIGYELGNGRLHANINAGAVVNIYSWQNGETLDTSFAPVSFGSDKTNSPYQYKTNAGIGFMGGVSVYYKLNDRLHLLAEPYFRYNFSPMNKEILSIQEKFSTIGLRLGLRIDL